MSETQVLLSKITALRQRLEQAQGLANEARSAAAALLQLQVVPLEARVAAGGEHDARMDQAMRQFGGASEREEGRPPRRLTTRARRVVERGRELLLQVRALADEFVPGAGAPARPTSEHLAGLYRETVAMVDTALRTVSLLPDSTAAQLHLCQGLEVTMEVVGERLRTLLAANARQRSEEDKLSALAALLTAVGDGQLADVAPFRKLAVQLLAEARHCEPLRFLAAPVDQVAAFVACHSLTVARVMARLVRHDPDLRGRAEDAVVSALLHDVGMLGVAPEVLRSPKHLDDDGRRQVEAHCRLGVELIAPLADGAPWLVEAVSGHHERLDGTGYPDGVRQTALDALTRLLSVCDVYTALCCPRPHRGPRSTRTALADTLLLAEGGHLDRRYAECLLHLSFYPVGSVVEMAHGALGVVVATPGGRRDLNSPARPVVAVLTDEKGEPLPWPHHLDLGVAEDHSIVRSLPAAEQKQRLGRRYPEWVAA